ncbi:MAG: hypothetical protein JSV96_19000 [Candidatus Aminicenantes bacterium]|nr:MAG: hypothetical protein JSV96_19000 [Candidatus Aminicenantes bacterium]
MRYFKNGLLLLLFGSLWGVVEVFAGEALFRDGLPYAEVWLAAWALFVLAVGRGIINKPGTSTIIGAFASVYKAVCAAPFFCHILAIFMLGFAFDIASTLLMKQERRVSFRHGLSGLASAYAGFAMFALTITYLVRYEYWTEVGLAKVLHHIFVSGSFAALIAVVAVPVGYWIGQSGGVAAERRPRWAYAGTLVALIILWALGNIV